MAFKSINQIFRRLRGIVLLNMAGLALGLTGVLFISIWIGHELSYDRFHEDHERIYRVESLLKWTGRDPFVWTVVPAPLAVQISKDYPEVESFVRMLKGYRPVIKTDEKELMEADELYFTSPAFFDLFSFAMAEGNPESALQKPNSIVLSESEALRLYGTTDALGKTLSLNVLQLKDETLFTVRGVMADPPLNSHLRPSYLLPFSMLDEKSQRLQAWGSFNILTYLKLNEDVDAEVFNQKLATYLHSKSEKSRGRIFLNPLNRIHLYRDPGFKTFEHPSAEKGPISRVYMLTGIGLALLLLACINFINLSTAYGASRAREIGVRKVSGAGRRQLAGALFSESFLQTVLSAVLALVFVMMLLPLFNQLTGLEAGIASVFSLRNSLIILGVTLIAGLLAGLHPALVLSAFRPVKVLRSGGTDKQGGKGLRKILVAVQLMLAIIFIFCIVVMHRQNRFMQNVALGFNKEQVMVITPRLGFEEYHSLADDLSRLPGVDQVALGNNVPVNMGNWQILSEWEGNTEETKLKFCLMQVDDQYLDMLGINIGLGRDLMEGAARNEVIVNEAAVRMMGMHNPLGKIIRRSDQDYRIVGIADDFFFRKLTEEVSPVFIYKDDKWGFARIFLKLEAGYGNGLINKISAVVKESDPSVPPDYFFLDEEIDRYYEQEEKLSVLINIFTVLSILLSSIGLFSLSAFTSRKRYREIGIRKVYGARESGLLAMLQKQLLLLILISSSLALPVAYYIVNRWLENYAYHIKAGPVFALIALLSVVFIASITVSYHTFRASRLNPAKTLRQE